MKSELLNADAKANFERDGYVIVADLLTSEESDLLRKVARADREIAADRSSRADGEGGSVDLVVRNDLPEDSIYGAMCVLSRWWKQLSLFWMTRSTTTTTR